MRWTTKTPTKKGWYWLKDQEGTRPVGVYLYQRDGGEELVLLELGSELDYVLPKGRAIRWAGPLKPPGRR